MVSNLAQCEILKSHLSFKKAHNFSGEKCFVFCFIVLFGSWIKIQLNRDLFVQPASLTEVSKWLSSVYKVICPTVNDLWVSKFRKVDVPCVSGWIVND